MRYEVVPAKKWINKRTGGTASLYGAHPCPGSSDWHIETCGWTVFDSKANTYGIGRPPWHSKQEAQAWADDHNGE